MVKIKLRFVLFLIFALHGYAVCPNMSALTPAMASYACESVEHYSWFIAPIPLSEANCNQPVSGSQCVLIYA